MQTPRETHYQKHPKTIAWHLAILISEHFWTTETAEVRTVPASKPQSPQRVMASRRISLGAPDKKSLRRFAGRIWQHQMESRAVWIIQPFSSELFQASLPLSWTTSDMGLFKTCDKLHPFKIQGSTYCRAIMPQSFAIGTEGAHSSPETTC